MNHLEKLRSTEIQHRTYLLCSNLSTFTATPMDLKKLAMLEAALPVAQNRELRRLAKRLELKHDIYGPNGRIYSFEGTWSVQIGLGGTPRLAFTNRETKRVTLFTPDELVHGQLRNGHGEAICF